MAQTEQVVQPVADASQTEVQTAEFEQVEEDVVAGAKENLDILLDINMPVTVNLGRTVIPFKQLLQMGPGSVLRLDKSVGQPADLYVQDIRFATGDVVVVDGCFAVRIKEVLAADAGEPAAE